MVDHAFDYQTEYDVYIENTPLEARFDPLTIQCLVRDAIPKHAAYDLSFEEYLEKRSALSEYDQTDKKRLSFYLPIYPSLRSQDYAYKYKLSITKFLVSIIELGLITFLYDYHDEITSIKDSREKMESYLTNERAGMLYIHLDRQKISLDSTAGSRTGGCKHFVPSCQEWLYNAVTDVAAYLNMPVSDLAYLCWCIGLQKTTQENVLDKLTETNIHNVLEQFNFEINILNKRIVTILMELSGVT